MRKKSFLLIMILVCSLQMGCAVGYMNTHGAKPGVDCETPQNFYYQGTLLDLRYVFLSSLWDEPNWRDIKDLLMWPFAAADLPLSFMLEATWKLPIDKKKEREHEDLCAAAGG